MVHVEGVPDTWHVTDKDAIVEVHVPAHSLIDIQTSQEERLAPAGTSGQGQTVLATVVAVDTLTKGKVQTQGASDRTRNFLPKTARLGNRSRSLCPG